MNPETPANRVFETEAVEYTPKLCRGCRRYYVSPKGARQLGCRQCYPMLGDTPEHKEGGMTLATSQSDRIPF